MTSKRSISLATIHEISEKLKQMPEIQKKSVSNKKDAVIALKKDIDAMVKKNYGFDEIAKILSENGIKITASSLKSYLSKKSKLKEMAA